MCVRRWWPFNRTCSCSCWSQTLESIRGGEFLFPGRGSSTDVNLASSSAAEINHRSRGVGGLAQCCKCRGLQGHGLEFDPWYQKGKKKIEAQQREDTREDTHLLTFKASSASTPESTRKSKCSEWQLILVTSRPKQIPPSQSCAGVTQTRPS